VKPDGMPRLYRMKDVEKWSETQNSGPQDGWTPKIGPTHPNCVCAPWSQWWAEIAEVHEGDSGRMRKLLDERGVYKEAA